MLAARMAAAAVACVIVGAGLSGCTAPRTPQPAPTASSAPAFPRLRGQVLATSQPLTGDWFVRIKVADPDSAYTGARALLEQAGYQLTKDRDGTDGGDGQACTRALCVSFTATDDPTFGPSVQYEVFHGTGIVG